MRNKALILSTLLYFILLNTSYLWEAKLGLIAFPVFILLAVIYIVLTILLLRQVYLVIKEKFKDRHRLIKMSLMTVMLFIIFLRPNGIINFDRIRGKDLLIAQAEGAANCTTTFKLKNNNKFVERTICFGVTEISGTYFLKGDTIIFNSVKLNRYENEYYKFAIINISENPHEGYFGELLRFRNLSDSIPHIFAIREYNFKK